MNDINPIEVQRFRDACRYKWRRYYKVSNTPDLIYQNDFEALYNKLIKDGASKAQLKAIWDAAGCEVKSMME